MGIKTAVKTAAFLLIGAVLFLLLQAVMMEKTSYGKYQSWKATEDVDILILGNSHADNALRAIDMTQAFLTEDGAEVSVFNFSVFGMRMEQMYYFAAEVLNDHTPDLIILETYAFCPLADEHREILAHRAFDVLPLGRNKIDGIRYCVLDDFSSFYIPFIAYHTRWKELTLNDIRLLYDESLWPFCGSNGSYAAQSCPDPGDGWFQQEPPEELRALTPTEEECLEKLLALLEEKDIPLLFLSVPYREQMDLNSMEQIKINNYLREHYVNGGTVRLLDLNRQWAELGFDYGYLFDEGHVNQDGSVMITAHLMDYLRQSYGIDVLAA